MKHKHYDKIVAWANGSEIEYRSHVTGTWHAASPPAWYDHIEYRIKLEPKPDVVFLCEIAKGGGCSPRVRASQQGEYNNPNNTWEHNARLVFDGETGKLKVVEFIK